jgi:CTP:molybdopterin cytidylyltransferase MocA
VLAAGAGRRFGPAGNKLLAEWRGRPILAHVLDTLAEARDSMLVEGGLVVRSPDSGEVERVCRQAGFDSVVAPDAETGIAASLKAGLAALQVLPAAATASAALVLLGDQPAVALPAIRAVVAGGADSHLALVRARYAAAAEPGHPTLIGRDHWGLARDLQGDRGFDPVLRARGISWTEVALPASNPDVDTAADLAGLEGD